MCTINECVLCEMESYEDVTQAKCKHNQGYASSIFKGGVYCIVCGLEIELR